MAEQESFDTSALALPQGSHPQKLGHEIFSRWFHEINRFDRCANAEAIQTEITNALNRFSSVPEITKLILLNGVQSPIHWESEFWRTNWRDIPAGAETAAAWLAVRYFELSLVSHDLKNFFSRFSAESELPPLLREWALFVLATRLGQAPPLHDYPFVCGPQAFYEPLKHLLRLNSSIVTDGYDRTGYIAVPEEKTPTTFDAIVEASIHRVQGSEFSSLDIGTGAGLVPIYVAAKAKSSVEKVSAVGTELSWAVAQRWPGAAIQRINGVQHILESDPGKLNRRFDFVSWFRPPLFWRDTISELHRAARSLFEIVKPQTILFFSFSNAEPPAMYWHLIRPLLSSLEQQGLFVRMREIFLASEMPTIDGKKSVSENVNDGRLLSEQYSTKPYHLLMEIGSPDEMAPFYLRPSQNFVEMLERVLSAELVSSTSDRHRNIAITLHALRAAS